MPIIKSAKKRVRIAEKAAIRNSKTKRTLKTALKAFRASITGADKNAVENQAKAQSAIDTAAKKGLIHKNKAARQKAQLARAAKNATAAGTDKPAAAKKAAKPATKTTATKKAATAKSAPAKSTAAAKKAPAKKPAAKK